MTLVKNNTALLNRFAHPGLFEEAFFTYLQIAGEKFDQSKTLMEVTWFHSLNVTGDSVTKFFQGGVNAVGNGNTNLDSFTRPESEHAIILAIRIREGVDAVLNNTDWTEGATSPEIKNSNIDSIVNGIVYLVAFDMNEAMDSLTTFDLGLIPLIQPIIWPGQTKAKFNVNYLTDPILNQNLKFSLIALAYTA